MSVSSKASEYAFTKRMSVFCLEKYELAEAEKHHFHARRNDESGIGLP